MDDSDNRFQKGDIVVLKSGGPRMTVDSPANLGGHLAAYCTWFSGNKYNRERFDEKSLFSEDEAKAAQLIK